MHPIHRKPSRRQAILRRELQAQSHKIKYLHIRSEELPISLMSVIGATTIIIMILTTEGLQPG